jgi:hypothetical protein
VGTTGGEIRHTEIRVNSNSTSNENASRLQNEKEED